VRLTVELEGRTTVVDVADDLQSVRVGERSFPLRVVARAPMRVDLEIGGETVAVAGWPEHNPSPTGPVDVNGERWKVKVRSESPVDARAFPRPTAPAPASEPSSASAAASSELPGSVPVVPPMPGRVVEVKVREGEAVVKGAVLLVLEAMKMRNELTSPIDGVVRDLRVREGANVRARELMLVLVPR